MGQYDGDWGIFSSLLSSGFSPGDWIGELHLISPKVMVGVRVDVTEYWEQSYPGLDPGLLFWLHPELPLVLLTPIPICLSV